MFEKLLALAPERKNAILNAALKEFSLKGFSEASTNTIAKNAGLTKPLMFHYIRNKKDFFLFLYDYCMAVLEKEYFFKVNVCEKDIFIRLRETSLLKIGVMRRYPCIFEFVMKAVYTDSDAVKDAMETRREDAKSSLYERFYGDIDTACFRDGLDVGKAMQLIFWAVGGYANHVMERFKNSPLADADFEKIHVEFDGYLNELKKVYYK